MTPRTVLVTGLSGAGKSVALKTLEDMGFEAIDNVPLTLIPPLVDSAKDTARMLALGTDVRNREFSSARFAALLEQLKRGGPAAAEVLFLDCDDEILRRRFTETRRTHPLALDRPVVDGIAREREILAPLRGMADVVFDTSEWTGAELSQALRERYVRGSAGLAVFVVSFSYKRGVPRDADMVFDARFLRNPFYEPALKESTGLDEEVGKFIERDPDFAEFFTHLTGLVTPLLPRFLAEGKSYLTLAIGCTGGRHRSVYTAQKLAGFLKKKEYKVGVRHRDLALKTPPQQEPE